MAQLVECFLCSHEDLSLVLTNHVKQRKPGMSTILIIPLLGKQRQGDAWLTGESKAQRERETLSQNKTRVIEEDTWHPPLTLSTCTHPHKHIDHIDAHNATHIKFTYNPLHILCHGWFHLSACLNLEPPDHQEPQMQNYLNWPSKCGRRHR